MTVPNPTDLISPLAATGSITTDTVAAILNARCNANIPLPSTVPGGAVPYGTAFPTGDPNVGSIPANCFDPVAVDLAKLYVPAPTGVDAAGNPFFQSVPNDHSHANQFTVKLDHRINDKQNLSVYYYFNDGFDSQPFTRFQAATPNLLPGFGNDNQTRSQQWNISDTWTLSPSSVNEFRITYFRKSQPTFLHPQRTNLVQDSCSWPYRTLLHRHNGHPERDPSNPRIGITPNLPNGAQHEGVPFITIQGGFTIGNDYEGELPQVGNTYQFSDNFTRVMGNHTAKFGVDFRIQKFFQTLYFDPNGDYTYSGGGPNDTGSTIGNYLLGLPDSYLQGSTQSEDIRSRSLYLFAQDSWKIRPNITFLTRPGFYAGSTTSRCMTPACDTRHSGPDRPPLFSLASFLRQV